MRHALARAFVRLSSLLVPSSYRDRFLEEWRAELEHERKPFRALERSLGSLPDALATRRLYGTRRLRSAPMGLRDVRFALRSFRGRVWWTAGVILTLAFGLGANTAVFNLFYTVLLRPLDYPESDRLVKIVGENVVTGEPHNLSPADFLDFEEESRSFASMGAHGWVGFFTLTGDGEPERVPGSTVTAGFFHALGVSPHLGRLFTVEDDQPGAAPTVILADALWQRRFGGDPSVVGRLVTINAVSHTIVGVLPARYRHPEPNPDREPALYTLFRFARESALRDGHFLRAVGRLRDGVDLDGARTELQGIATRLEAAYPESNTHRGIRLLALKDAVVHDARTGLFVLLGAVGAVLLITCANIANLQMAQAGARRKELATKAALGAGRGRLVRELVTESLVLSLSGGALGLVLAYWGRNLLMLGAIPRAGELSFHLPVFSFAFAVSTLAAMGFGIVPALWLSSGDLRREMRNSRPRGLLVACEVAVALVLLVGAGLLMKSFSELRHVAPGFSPDHVLTFQVSLPTARYGEDAQIPFYEELYEKIAVHPGVRSVGAVNILPLSQGYSKDFFQIEERPVPEGEAPAAEARSLGGDYFDAMRIRLLRGRTFDDRDRADSPRVVVISESMAKTFWPGEDPLGKRITYNRGVADDARKIKTKGGPGSREIVGIVGDVKHLGLDDGDIPMYYTPQTQPPSFPTMTLVLRTTGRTDVVAQWARNELQSMDASIPLYRVRSLDKVLEQTVEAPRFRAYLLAVFAASALALAAIGVYGVVGMSVVRRTREIGIRMALGAGASRLVAMIVWQSLKPVAWGLVLGSAAAVFGTKYLESLLFGVTTSDVSIYLVVAGLLGLSALGAALLPGLKTLKVDPVQTLRAE